MSGRYFVVSNQTTPHPLTMSRAQKHADTIYLRPYATSQVAAFKETSAWLSEKRREIVLDSGCGTGDSTFFLAKKYPDMSIIGIDRSQTRIRQATEKLLRTSLHDNIFFVRARLEDFWRLARDAGLEIESHFLFYPNPCPKSEHHSRRWHGHAVFPDLLTLSNSLEIRSNWRLYLEEFAIAARTLIARNGEVETLEVSRGISAFEKKYFESGSHCYRLRYTNLPKVQRRPFDLITYSSLRT